MSGGVPKRAQWADDTDSDVDEVMLVCRVACSVVVCFFFALNVMVPIYLVAYICVQFILWRRVVHRSGDTFFFALLFSRRYLAFVWFSRDLRVIALSQQHAS